MLEAIADFHADDRNLGVPGVNAHHRSSSDSRALVARVVKNPLCSRLHLAKMLHGSRVGHPVPIRLFIPKEIIVGVDAGLCFEEEVGHGFIVSEGPPLWERRIRMGQVSC